MSTRKEYLESLRDLVNWMNTEKLDNQMTIEILNKFSNATSFTMEEKNLFDKLLLMAKKIC